MKFKEPHMAEEYKNLPWRLRKIAEDFDRISQAFEIESVVTRVLDPVEGESGVHPAGRAVDFRDEHGGSFLYTEKQMAAIVEFLNDKYKRSDWKKVCIHHSFNGGPAHAHLQIPYEWA